MRKMMRAGLVGLLALSVLVLPLGSAVMAMDDRYVYEDEPADGGPMIYDAVIVRPISIVATVAGAAFWLVGLPFAALGGNVDQATDKLIVAPAKYTFQRPLGQF